MSYKHKVELATFLDPDKIRRYADVQHICDDGYVIVVSDNKFMSIHMSKLTPYDPTLIEYRNIGQADWHRYEELGIQLD